MTNNFNKTDTHIYNIINNPPKVFTEPCEACGVSEFYLGARHAEERIIKVLEEHLPKTLRLVYEVCLDETGLYDANEAVFIKDALIALIKGEQK